MTVTTAAPPGQPDLPPGRTGLDAPRPLLIGNPRARLRELLEERLPVYEALAWVTVITDDRAPQEIADEVAAAVTARMAAEAGEGAGTSPGWPPLDPAAGDPAGGAPEDRAGPAADPAGPAGSPAGPEGPAGQVGQR